MIVTMMTMMMVMMMIMMMSMMMMMMMTMLMMMYEYDTDNNMCEYDTYYCVITCMSMILIIKQVMMPYTSDSLIILTYPKTRHSESKK